MTGLDILWLECLRHQTIYKDLISIFGLDLKFLFTFTREERERGIVKTFYLLKSFDNLTK